MPYPHLNLDVLPDDKSRIEAIRQHAQMLGAIMAVSGHFCPPNTYWADIIAPGHACLGRGTTPLAAALDAFRRFTQADHMNGSSSLAACSRYVST